MAASWRTMPAMTRPIALVGSPTALGGHFGGMERTPSALRAAGLMTALAARPGIAQAVSVDAGDAINDPGWVADPDPRAKNRDRLCAYLPRLAGTVVGGRAGARRRGVPPVGLVG